MAECPCPTYAAQPHHLNHAKLLRACQSQRPLTHGQETSQARYLNVIYGGCKQFQPPRATRADGVVAALTHRPDHARQGIQPCPMRAPAKKPCPRPCRQPCRPLCKQTPCESHQRPASFYKKHQKVAFPGLASHRVPPDLVSPCPRSPSDSKLGVPPYVVSEGCETGTPIVACTDRDKYERRKLAPTRPVPLQPGRVDATASSTDHGDDCFESRGRPVADCVDTAEVHRMRRVNTCGLTGVAGVYRGNHEEHLPDIHPEFHRQRAEIDLNTCLVPWTSIPPYINTNQTDHGVPVRCGIDCVRKLCGTKCRHPVPCDDTCPEVRSVLADIGFYNTSRGHRSVYPCCATKSDKQCATKTYRWTSVSQLQMNEMCYPPKTMVLSNTTYEPQADQVRCRAQRYEPVTAFWQQVPTVWDKAQARPPIDHVQCDHEYTPKITETLPTEETCTALVDRRCTIEWLEVTQSVSTTSLNHLANCSSLPSVADDSTACSFIELNDTVPVDNQMGVVVTVVVVVSASVVFVVVAIVVGQVLLTKHRRRQPSSSGSASTRQRYKATSSHRPDASDVFIDVDQLPMNDAYDYITITSTQSTLDPHSPKLSRLECDRNAIAYCKDKSDGAFGSVFVATLAGVNGFTSATNVVVKTLRPDVDEAARRDFIRAGELLAGLSHPNIIRVVGACLQSEPICLIFEHMSGGELCDYLRVTRPRHHIYRDGQARLVIVAELVAIARQIADAMLYFSSCGYVHRDLAARNCLVSDAVSPDPPIVKLADFGLAVQLDDREFYRGADDEEIPVRWMPPEAIVESRFAPSSDVWSFAVLVWEVFSFGAKPYEGLSSQEAARRIVNGKVLERPDLTPSLVYDLMRLCWNADPSKRPNFETVHQHLVDLEQRARNRVIIP